MGKPMAQNLIKDGHSLRVHSRSRGPVDELVAAGAKAADSPADVARHASIVITMLPDTPDGQSSPGRTASSRRFNPDPS